MVPNGWRLTSLGDISSKVQTGPFGSQLHAHEYTDEGIPVLMPKDLINGRANINSAAKIPETRADDLAKHKLKKGDILFSRRGDVARFGLITEESEGALCGTGCLKASISKEHSALFLSYFLQKSAVRKWLEQNAVGQTMLNLNTTILSELPIMVASSKQEQQKIAKILSTWDNAISTTERLIDNSTQQKKALMQQLLTGKKRLLDDEGKMFEGGWKKVKLGELFNFSTASSKSKFIDNFGQNYILDMGSVTRDGKLKPTKKTLIDKDFLSKGQLIMPKDDIGGGQIIGRVGYVDENCKYILSDHVYCLTSKEGCSLFLSYLINSYPINKQIRRQANGTAQLGLGKKDAEKQTVTVPLELEEQQKIATVLTNADKEIELLEQQLADLQQEKKALMQVLLTGKKRVKLND